MDSSNTDNNNNVHEPMLQSNGSEVEPVSSELEEALSDDSLSFFQRIKKATWIELKNLFRLAAPAILVYMLNNLVAMSTQIFCGHLGNLELAAVSLGNTGIQVFAYGLMVRNCIYMCVYIYNYCPITIRILFLHSWEWEALLKLYVAKLTGHRSTTC